MPSYVGARVCIYGRVSTTRQAKNDLSIPDQIDRGKQWCEQSGAVLVDTVVEPGASATDDDRPRFQEMIARATSEDHPYDVILIHSLSRLFRNALHFMQYRHLLKRSKVAIVSITQGFGDDPAAELAIGMLALFDEYHSVENAKHTQRAMLANARLGFWNGQTPPLGYRTYEAERREGKSKRKLEIDEDEAFIVRKVFDLYLNGPPGALPLGITRLAAWLNAHGYKYRGAKFHVSNVQALLRNIAYVGVALYNKRDSRTGEVRPESEWVPIPVPPIIDAETFEIVQARLVDRRALNRPARVTTTDNLLIGLVRCGCGDDGCGGGMTTSTGKSGRYKYYACSNRARAGLSVCKGRRISMPKLDDIVTSAIEERVLQPNRLKELLSGWLDLSADATAARREALRQLRARQTAIEAGLDRLLDLVAEGHLTAHDDRFSRKYAEQTAQLNEVKTDIVMLERQLATSERRITPARLEAFAGLMRERLRGENVALRQYYVRAIVDRIEVGDTQIRIRGATKALEHAVGRFDAAPGMPVPNIEREWRARQDSNLQLQA